ncbi:MAG: hypothetical protein ACTSV7_11590 [Candidatus Baldrarchaeia archaeon]
MDPAEEIVSLWLQQKGFFIRHNVKVGYRGKEIDFLAVNIENDKRVHVEVHASVFPLGPLRPWSPAKYGRMPVEDRVKYYYLDKFVGPTKEGTGELVNRCIEETVKRILKTDNYEKWLVLGALHKMDSEDQLKKEFDKHGVKVFFLKDILKEIQIEGTARDRTGRFIQLLASQLTDEAKERLLKRK